MYMFWSLISFILYNDFVKVLTFKDFISFLFQKILQDISKILKIFFLKSIPSWHAYCIVNKSLNAIITTGFYHCNGSFQKLFWIEAIFILHKKYDEDSICDLMGAQYLCHVQSQYQSITHNMKINIRYDSINHFHSPWLFLIFSSRKYWY